MARKMLSDGELNNAAAAEEATETHYDFDLFVIGAGSGGVRAARFSANNGAKVGICELPFHPISSEEIGGVGGTCVIRGCVPKKILVYGATYGGELERLLANAAVKLYEGEGRIVGPNEVEVRQIDGTKISYTAKHILIATGSRAQKPNIPGHELAITSDEALSLEDFPKRAIVLGGGYIAVEFASIWRGMGATVDLFFRKELPLRGFDDEMRALVARNLEGRGRIPNTKRLNLEAVGVELDQAGAVDEYSRTNIPSIWAVGDATNRINLTPVALMEATCFANTVFGGKPTEADYTNVACAVFCIPPLAVVGLSEEEAVEKATGDILVFTSGFNPMKNTISGRQEKTLMKLIVDEKTDKGIAIALKCGATKAQFDSTVGIHPSSAEEFVTMRTVTRRIAYKAKPQTSL
ncbi:hypothetical protein DY000_02022753 [Brassica cretica]|uniref:Glutathione-disulfide reductase n=1 Tax=Brassica cretica TaxID=69181 RepID=A0ABQ7EJI3_BRACR|nr:hypothetical protein DY000_02022753 [Brassica cretica]